MHSNPYTNLLFTTNSLYLLTLPIILLSITLGTSFHQLVAKSLSEPSPSLNLYCLILLSLDGMHNDCLTDCLKEGTVRLHYKPLFSQLFFVKMQLHFGHGFVKFVSFTTCLGVMIDNQLSWHAQVDRANTSFSEIVGALILLLPRSGCKFSPLAASHFLVRW